MCGWSEAHGGSEEVAIDTLVRIRQGDEGAFGELLEREWQGLVRFLTPRCASPAAAEDAAQEACVRLWERRESWQAGSARALLYRIALNVALDEHRRRAMRAQAREEIESPQEPARPDEELERSRVEARLAAALEGLPEKRREVFRLVRLCGLTYREVAEVTGLSAQTVANHMSLALGDLRSALAGFLERPNADTASEERSSDG